MMMMIIMRNEEREMKQKQCYNNKYLPYICIYAGRNTNSITALGIQLSDINYFTPTLASHGLQ